MATQDVPQRQLRNETAKLLRRVEAGERLRVTVHGHPVAELGPPAAAPSFLPRERVLAELGGLLDPADTLEQELRAAAADAAADPFE
jgi:prevent-host-death family protein